MKKRGGGAVGGWGEEASKIRGRKTGLEEEDGVNSFEEEKVVELTEVKGG